MRHVQAPCPGCGAKGKYRVAAEVCDDCKGHLQRAKETEAALLRLTQERGYEIIKHSPVAHWNPGYYGDYEFLDVHSATQRRWPAVDADARDALRRAFTDLVHAVGDPVVVKVEVKQGFTNKDGWHTNANALLRDPRLREMHGYDGLSNPEAHLRMLPEVAICLRRLDAAIRAALASVHAAGRVSGEDLLARIAAGELSVHTFNELNKGSDNE